MLSSEKSEKRSTRNTILIPIRSLCLFISVMVLSLMANAQGDTISQNRFNDDILLTEINPMHSFGIFTFNTPFYIGSFHAKERKFSVGYSYGNTWHPQSTVYYPQNMTLQQELEVNSLYITDRPDFFNNQGIQTRQKTFSTDGVLQSLNFTYLMQFAHDGSFIFKLNTHLLSGGGSPLHYLASDEFIEKFHTSIGLDDNFGRKLFAFNQAQIRYQDEDGKTIQINKGQAFLGTFDINYYHPIWQKEKRASYYSIQAGAHLTLPLNKFYPKVAGGLSTSLLFRKKIFPGFYADLAGDFSLSDYSLLSIGKSINMIDRNIRISAKSYIAFNLVSKRNRMFTFGLINNYQDAFLKGYIFSDTQDEYKNLGVSYLDSGDQWNGTVIKEPVRLSKLTAASMYFFSIKSYPFLSFKWGESDLTITAGEDYLVVNNAPDIQFGLQYIRKFGW